MKRSPQLSRLTNEAFQTKLLPRHGMASLQAVMVFTLAVMVVIGTHSLWGNGNNGGIRGGTVASLDKLLHGTSSGGSASGADSGNLGGWGRPPGGNQTIDDLPWGPSNDPNFPGSDFPSSEGMPISPYEDQEDPLDPNWDKEPVDQDETDANRENPQSDSNDQPQDEDEGFLTQLKDFYDSMKDMSPEEREAAKEVGKTLVDVVGIVDPTGVADLASTIIAISEGDGLGIVTGAIGTIFPYLGDVAKVAKLGRYADSINNVIKLAAKNPKFAEAVKGPLEQLQKGLAKAAYKLPDSLGSVKKQLTKIKTKIDDGLLAIEKQLLPKRVKNLAESNVVDSNMTIIGRFKKDNVGSYDRIAEDNAASYFSIPKGVYDKLNDAQRWAANSHFLDVIAAKGDKVILASKTTKDNINGFLKDEIDYLIKKKGYVWYNDRILIKP